MSFYNWIINPFKKKEKPKNWPHLIIDFLYQHYSETYTELNDFLYSDLKLEKHNTTHKDKIRELLDEMEAKKYIIWIANLMDRKTNRSTNAQYRETFKGITNDGLDAARIEARLTLDGLDYAIELRRDRQKHRYFLTSTPVALVLSILAFGVSIWTTFIKPTGKPAPQKIELLQSDTIPIQIVPETLQNGHTLPPNHSTNLPDLAKPTLDTPVLLIGTTNKVGAKK